MEVHLLLYYSSNACGYCTRALTSHLHFPSILTPLGLKLLTNHRGSPPVSPCLLPSHLPVHTKTASVPQTKTWIKPNLQILNLLRQTRHQVLTALSWHPNWLVQGPRSLTRSVLLRSEGLVWICQEELHLYQDLDLDEQLPSTRTTAERRQEAPAKRRAGSCRAQPRSEQCSSNGPLL